jgi:hypothetical protein
VEWGWGHERREGPGRHWATKQPFELEQVHERLYLTDDVWRATVTGSLAAETGRGSGAGLGGAGGREGGQHDDAACNSWENAISFE